MSTTIKELKPIPENPPRWEPSLNPTSITVAGLDTTASVTDQIDQIDQLITLKLQVSLELSMFLS
jgi:DASH complex subunit ASK1